MRRFLTNVDFSVLVDVISNAAGMMMLVACIALLVGQQDDPNTASARELQAKPISFPLAYIPEKRSVTICLKYGKLYLLPEEEAMIEVEKKTLAGTPLESIDLTKDGVLARIMVTRTATGFIFLYRMLEEDGLSLKDSPAVVKTLQELVTRYPPSKFFIVIHCWSDSFQEFREIREFLQDRGMEVGWQQRDYLDQEYDIVQAIGEYDKNLTSIKAQ